MTTLLASRRAASRLARVASATASKRSALPAASSSLASPHAASRFLSTGTGTPLTREDVTDDHGLLQFKTLHEMNHYASVAFRDNPLFGTYKAPQVDENVVEQKEGTGTFEWMTYGEYGDVVERCRTVLKDIGEFDVLCSQDVSRTF